MKLTFIFSVLVRAGKRAAGKHRIRSGAAAMCIVTGAAAVALAGGPANEPASAILQPWHVGPVPEIRTICHAGDSLWVGTNVGVFVVDIRDASRRVLIPAGPTLPSNSVRAIAARGDSVWVATDSGVAIFHNGKTTVMSARDAHVSKDALPLRDVQQIAFGSGGEILLATREGGVGVLTDSRNYTITTRDSLIDDNVYDILDRAGRPRLYACGAGVCAQVDDTTMVSFQAGAGLPRGEARQVVGDAQNAFVRIARRGVFQFDGRHANELSPPRGISFVDANSIAFGADHTLWVAGPGWICMLRSGHWKVASAPPLNWRVIVADGAGAFAGSADGVVMALNRGAEFKLVLGDGLPGASVASLRPDGKGNAWFVSGGRVVCAGSRGRTLSVENAPVDAEAVEFSPAGMLLAAGRWNVSRKGASGWADMTPRLMDSDPAFASVSVDAQNMVWVGARSGALYRYDGEIWLRYEKPRANPEAVFNARAYPVSDWALVGSVPLQGDDGRWNSFADWDSTVSVVDVAEDPAGDWFAATRDRLYRYDAQRAAWQSVSPAGAASKAPWDTPGDITAIAFDPSGRLFVGTGDGFGSVRDGRPTWWNVTNGIGGERVRDLAADAATLWVGYGNDGLSAFALTDLR